MRAIIGAKLLASSIAQPAAKPFEIYDTRLPGFALRVQPSGVRSYYARFGRNRRISLGKVGELLPDEARGKCQKVLGNVAHGRHPLSGLFGPDGPTLGEFVQETFTPWAQANRPRGANPQPFCEICSPSRAFSPAPSRSACSPRIRFGAWTGRALIAGPRFAFSPRRRSHGFETPCTPAMLK